MYGAILVPAAACAQETTTYTYDAKGRVVAIARTGGPSQGVATTYSYDKADNRTNVSVSNSPKGSGSGGDGATSKTMTLIVVPLNGFTIIPVLR